MHYGICRVLELELLAAHLNTISILVNGRGFMLVDSSFVFLFGPGFSNQVSILRLNPSKMPFGRWFYHYGVM